MDSQVIRVELFEDRAAVTRTLTLDTTGRQTLRLEGLSPLLRPSSVSFPGERLLILEDLRVHRQTLTTPQADPETLSRRHQRVREAQARVAASEDSVARQHEALQRAKSTLALAQAHTGRALTQTEGPAWVSSLRRLAERVELSASNAQRHSQDLADRKRELRLAERALQEARQGKGRRRATLTLQAKVLQTGTLRVRYIIPCAVWRPRHRATLDTAAGEIRWEVGATCWNSTGEDWTQVELICSTARPGDRAAPPKLTDDPLHIQRRDSTVHVEAREEEVAVAREATSAPPSTSMGVDDGGQTRTWAAQGLIDLPSTGAPIHVPLATWQAPAEVTWWAAPERSPQVVLQSRQRQGGPRPLLAGPVQLIRDGMAVGHTEVGLIPSDEPFRLGWGSHDSLQVLRTVEHHHNRHLISGRQQHRFEIKLRVHHLGAEAVEVELRERLPVSELKEISVTLGESRPPLTDPPNPDGLCGWRITLLPDKVQELTLSYSVLASAQVALPF